MSKSYGGNGGSSTGGGGGGTLGGQGGTVGYGGTNEVIGAGGGGGTGGSSATDWFYGIGYRDGEASREADIRIAVTHSRTWEELLQRLRDMTGCQDMELGEEYES